MRVGPSEGAGGRHEQPRSMQGVTFDSTTSRNKAIREILKLELTKELGAEAAADVLDGYSIEKGGEANKKASEIVMRYIEPRMIYTGTNLQDTFGAAEREFAASKLIRNCQAQNSWSPVGLPQSERYLDGTPFAAGMPSGNSFVLKDTESQKLLPNHRLLIRAWTKHPAQWNP